MAIDRAFITPKMEIDQERYEELIRAELKAEQYKKELQRLGEYDYLINIIEAIEVNTKELVSENENKNESEEK